MLMTRWLWPTTAAVAMAVLSACAGSGGPTAVPTPHNARTSHSSAAAQPSSAVPASLHGIVIGNEVGSDVVHLEAVDSQTGAVMQKRTFSGGGADLALTTFDRGLTWRQRFDAGFTRMVANGPDQSDGSRSAGYMTYQGGYSPVTTSPGGYGTVLRYGAIGFDPGNGNLWFLSSPADGSGITEYGYVNLTTHLKHLLPNHDWSSNGMPDTISTEVYFVPDRHGQYEPVPTPTGLDSEQVFLSGGPEVQRDPVNDAYQVGPYLSLNVDSNDNYHARPIPSTGIPWMDVPVDSHRFLGHDVESHQIYIGRLDGAVVHLHPLLPDSNWTVGDMVVSPDRTQVAFVSTDPGGESHLFVTSLSANGAQPRMLPGSDAGLSHSSRLLAWIN